MRGDPAPLQQSLQRRIKRAIVDEKFVFGLVLEELRDAVRVIRGGLQAAKDEDFECALKELQRFPLFVYRRHSTYYLRPHDRSCRLKV